MKNTIKFLALGLIVVLSACGKKAPKHAKYIPADATAIFGINTESMGKKAAWSTISGSPMMQDLLDNIGDEKGKEAVQGLDKAGIEWMSTFYVYTKSDARYNTKNKFALVLPLKDRKAWEAYLQKLSPKAFTQVNGRSEALIENKAYAGWNDEVLIVINGITKDVEFPEIDFEDPNLNQDSIYEAYSQQSMSIDEPAAALEMESVFTLKKDKSIIENDKFNRLQNENHDLNAYVNYGAIMKGNDLGDLGAMAMTMGKMYEGSFSTVGIDFHNGQVDGEMKYYPAKDMEEIASKLANSDVDKDMVGRLPGANNVAVAANINPEGIKMMLDKMGMIGLLNIAVAKMGITADDLFAAFTGNMAFQLSNLSMKEETSTYEGMDGPETYTNTVPEMKMMYVMEIKDKAAIQKLMTVATSTLGLKAEGAYYAIPGMGGDFNLFIGEKYMVLGNDKTQIAGYVANSLSPKISDDVKGKLVGHPSSIYADLQSVMVAMRGEMTKGGGKDSMYFQEAQKTFKEFAANGGEYKGDAINYRMSLHMMNTQENSLVQMINFAKKMSEYNKIEMATEVEMDDAMMEDGVMTEEAI